MKTFNELTVYLFISFTIFSCGSKQRAESSTAEDIKEVKKIVELKTLKIGSADWTAENLDVTTFRNGDTIPETKTAEEWVAASKGHKAAWCFYENNAENGKKYGKLYNFYAVSDSRGIAPEGYHVPSVSEFKQISDIFGKEAAAVAKKMKSTSGWGDKGNGDNASGFNALPGGSRSVDGEYVLLGMEAFYWSKDSDDDGAHGIILVDKHDFRLNTDYRGNGCSLRLIKDK
jgi:uncharacterized protein (TIGR02145 family)